MDYWDTVAAFCDLFDGRHDVIGTDDGGCVRLKANDIGPSWTVRIQGHLDGIAPIGVYPLTDFGVKWGATDLDYTDDPTEAQNISAVLAHFGITGWVEISRSKGFHVLVFAESWVPATTMRGALAAAHQIAEVKATELNPKQVTFDAERPGNYLRAPYPGALARNDGFTADGRRIVIANGWHLCLQEFVEAATEQCATLAQLQALADLYIAPPPKQTVHIGEPPADLKAVTDKLSSLGWTIYSKGPLDGQDRSSHLVRMTHEFRRCGLTPAEALLLLRDADTRVRKFADRVNAEDFYVDIVERVYG